MKLLSVNVLPPDVPTSRRGGKGTNLTVLKNITKDNIQLNMQKQGLNIKKT